MGLPIVVSRQYPKGLGETIPELCETLLSIPHNSFDKCSFSCLGPEGRDLILQLPVTEWVVAGIETHICVQQTAIDLALEKKKVIIPACAVSSRLPSNTLYALEELRTCSRITTTEAYLFERLKTSQSPHFKVISELVK
jgi:nicotinamidase-related amidase